VIPIPDPAAADAPVIAPGAGRDGGRAHTASAAAAATVVEPDDPTSAPDLPVAAGVGSAVGVIRFEAIGEAWRLFRQRAGLWMLAALLTVVLGNAVQFALFFLSIPMSIMGGVFLRGALSPLMGLASLAAGLAVWGVFLGGMFRMALRQVDGRPIALKDLSPRTDALPGLGLAAMLAGLATFAGFLFLFLPGFVVAGLLMFALPLIIDARLGALDAIRASASTLKDHWLAAAVMMPVLWTLQIAGMLVCGLGGLATLPVAFLSIAILYRGFFPRGGASKKPIPGEIDPDFGPIAAPDRPRERIPAWAWLTAVASLMTPVVAAGLATVLFVGLFASAFRGMARPNQLRFEAARRAFERRQAELARDLGQPAPGANAADLEARMKKMMEQPGAVE
jgi:uncharacterized membrane protein